MHPRSEIAAIHNYTVSLTSRDGFTIVSQTTTMLDRTANVTMFYNTNYSMQIIATNCAGSNLLATLEPIAIGNIILL